MEKKDKNRFVSWVCSLDDEKKTLDEVISEYKVECDEHNKLLQTKEEIEDKIAHETDNGKDFTLKEILFLYDKIREVIEKEVSDTWMYKGINLLSLQGKIEELDSDVEKYIEINNELDRINRNIEYIEKEAINFISLRTESTDVHCSDHHHLVRFDDELICTCCGATTKEYDLTKEELDFLTKCANSQGDFEMRLAEDEKSLLQVLRENYLTTITWPDWPDEDDEKAFFSRETESEERWLNAESEAFQVILGILKARLLDAGKTYDGETRCADPKFLSDEESEKLLESAREQLEQAEKSDSRFKDLMIEECKTAMYEALILSGKHIPTLFKEAEDDETKDIIAKAYYNILHNVGNYGDLYNYDCYTALPEINNRVLKMKLRRENSK